jgi:hypothetical protein
MVEWEDARDPAVLKCSLCSRYAAPPRPHEQPPKREAKEEWGDLRAIDGDAYYEHQKALNRDWKRADYHKKKQGAA